jgi:hypothetical protein
MDPLLTKDEFATALRRGQGRAFRYVKEHGLDEVATLVLDACLRDLAYDPQCEASRAEWLFDMFKDGAPYGWLSGKILEALRKAEPGYDFEQLCELAALMASRGEEQAADLLRTRVLTQPFGNNDWPRGLAALVSVDGEGAIVEIARRVGRVLLEDPATGVPTLASLTDSKERLADFERKLSEFGQADEEIAAFMDHERRAEASDKVARSKSREERERELREQARRDLPIEKILDHASKKQGTFPGQYTRFGRYATESELRMVMDRLSTESDDEVSVRLLWVFRRAALPEIHPRIWELAQSKNDALRAAAVEALAQIRDERVSAFGRAQLVAGELPKIASEVIDLFTLNYQARGEELISAAVQRIAPSEDEAHGLGLSILRVCKKNQSPAFSGSLGWVYETTPCTICRHDALKELVALERHTPEMIADSLFDAEEDTRKLARAVMEEDARK